ncbi:MAG: hypothetical protein CFE45_20565 [Burkholderiales bacterium PBB5]|nr:MAG: hypothetical protein CFE45_20565 [Burkholderiales bacterium PBB5]
MIRITELRLPLDHAPDALRAAVLARLGLADAELAELRVFRRGYDARKKSAIVLSYTLDLALAAGVDEAAVLARHPGDTQIRPSPDTSYRFVGHAPADFAAPAPLRPVVVGFGPCGLFAALILAQMGLRPLVLERGKAVRERTQDTWGLWRRRELNPESNVQFGEGGAGTFSDGKLWSQISDPRHLTRKVLTEFVKAGAPDEILWVSKPHIGTFRLVSMIEKMRAEIEALGGEIRFQQRVTDLRLEPAPSRGGGPATFQVRGLTLASGEQIDAEHVVLARNGRSVYSFCMCPGGTVVAATSEAGRVVTNGMSQYSRNERNANAGIVVGISPQDYRQDGAHSGPVNPLDGMAYQRFWESRAFELGGGDYSAPGQLVGDFVAGRHGTAIAREVGSVLPSYKPGVTLTDLAEPGRGSLPDDALAAVREALPAFERQIKGFAMPDAVLTGVETRTSSPLRINRGRDYQSLNVRGLYPAGEGAGYAGGIMSAGVDGIEVAEALAQALLPRLAG